MIVGFKESVTGTDIYINPSYVVTARPDPEDPMRNTLIRLRDGENIRVAGDHKEVVRKLSEVTGRLSAA